MLVAPVNFIIQVLCVGRALAAWFGALPKPGLWGLNIQYIAFSTQYLYKQKRRFSLTNVYESMLQFTVRPLLSGLLCFVK